MKHCSLVLFFLHVLTVGYSLLSTPSFAARTTVSNAAKTAATNNTVQRTLKCPFCPSDSAKRFTKNELETHMEQSLKAGTPEQKLHSNGRKYQCPDCVAKYDRTSGYNKKAMSIELMSFSEFVDHHIKVRPRNQGHPALAWCLTCGEIVEMTKPPSNRGRGGRRQRTSSSKYEKHDATHPGVTYYYHLPLQTKLKGVRTSNTETTAASAMQAHAVAKMKQSRSGSGSGSSTDVGGASSSGSDQPRRRSSRIRRRSSGSKSSEARKSQKTGRPDSPSSTSSPELSGSGSSLDGLSDKQALAKVDNFVKDDSLSGSASHNALEQNQWLRLPEPQHVRPYKAEIKLE